MSVSERRKKVEGYDAVIIGSAGKFQLHIFIVAWEDTIYQEILFQTNQSEVWNLSSSFRRLTLLPPLPLNFDF